MNCEGYLGNRLWRRNLYARSLVKRGLLNISMVESRAKGSGRRRCWRTRMWQLTPLLSPARVLELVWTFSIFFSWGNEAGPLHTLSFPSHQPVFRYTPPQLDSRHMGEGRLESRGPEVPVLQDTRKNTEIGTRCWGRLPCLFMYYLFVLNFEHWKSNNGP